MKSEMINLNHFIDRFAEDFTNHGINRWMIRFCQRWFPSFMLRFIERFVHRFVNRETVTYLLIGVLATIISFGTYYGMGWLGFGVVAANTIATVIAVAAAFILNKIIVFRSVEWVAGKVIRELLSFCGGRLATYLMETALLVLTVEHWGLPNFWCKCGTSVLVVIANYIISKWFVFKRPA